MIRVVIIDDEKRAREIVAKLLKEYFPELFIVAEADSINTGVQVIEQYKPDIVFLDINMNDGTAFDLLSKLNNIDFKLIFITAYSEYAIKSIKFSAIDYILKPIDIQDFSQAIKRAIDQIELDKERLKIKTFLSNQLGLTPEKKIVLKNEEDIQVIDIKDIIRCEARGEHTIFYYRDNETMEVKNNIREYELLLSDYDFFRVHKDHLINLNNVAKFTKYDNVLYMKDKSKVPISIHRREMLIELLERKGLCS